MFFDPALLATGIILAGTMTCPPQKPAEVAVTLKTIETPYITNVTSQQLTQTPELKGPDSTSSTDGHWMVGGLLKSDIGGRSLTQFQTLQNPKTMETCLYVTKVDFELVYKPVIYIASDFKSMGCRYSATVAHEKRHMATDIRAITDTIPSMKKMVTAHAAQLKPVGPFPAAQLEMEKQKLSVGLNASLEPAVEQLKTIRRQRQAMIDTKENYLRDTALCPGQFPKFDGSAP